MRAARLAERRRLCEDVCVFCLARGARPRASPIAPTSLITRNFSRSVPTREDSTPGSSTNQPGPKKFGGFAAKSQQPERPVGLDWGDRKERNAASSAMASRTVSAPRFDDVTPNARSAQPRSTSRPPASANSNGNGNGSGFTIRRTPSAPDSRRQATLRLAREYQQRDAQKAFEPRPAVQARVDQNAQPGSSAAAEPEPPRRRYVQREQQSPDVRPPPFSRLGSSARSFRPRSNSVSFQPQQATPQHAQSQYPRAPDVISDASRRSNDTVVQEQSTSRAVRQSRHEEAPRARSRAFADEQQDKVIRQPRDEEAPQRRHRTFETHETEVKAKRGVEKGKMDKGDRRAQKFTSVEEDEEGGFDDEEMEARREKKRKRKAAQQAAKEAAAAPKNAIELPSFISVQSLATALRVRPEEFSAKLEELGFENVGMDHIMNAENAGLVAMEYGLEPVVDTSDADDIKPRPAIEDTSSLPLRPPIVTIMGHVDHGKTTLLDYLRQSSVAASEHGGITQHIGAFSVPIASASNRLVTFLDTPGHAAFLSMRQRGATVTDIVVLVVAADDSVKPQTIEAIKHAKSAGVQIIVAITKCDKDSANPQRVKTDLIQHDIEVEDLGGSIQAIEVSGKTGAGITALEDALIAQADVLDTRADATGAPEGWVLEAATRKSGRTATVLVRRGTLHTGAILVAGTTWARVRSLTNEAGARVASAGPGTPVEVDGWREQPAAGDEVLGAPSESRATDVVSFRRARAQRIQASVDAEAINAARRSDAERRAVARTAASEAAARMRAQGTPETPVGGRHVHEAARAAREEADRAFRRADGSDTPAVYIVVKADVAGSVEAVVEGLRGLPLGRHGLALSVLRAGVGAVSESDVAYAAAAPAGHGFVVNFAQEMGPGMAALAERAGVRVLDQTIIYRVIDEMRAAVEERLPPVVTRRVIGEAEAVAAFEIRAAGGGSGGGGAKGAMARIAGCRVKNGVVMRGEKVRVFRGGVGGEVVYEGRVASLKNVKRDVAEMRKGTECGMAFEGWDGFVEGDVIQCFEEIKETRRLV